VRATAPAAALLWLALAAQAPPPPLLPAPANGDFSAVAGDVPVGWTVNRRIGGDPGVTLTATPEGAARLVPTSVPASQRTRLVQRFDAAPWRGEMVRLSARVRILDAGIHVGLRLNVERPDGLQGYYDDMEDMPLTAGGWRDVALKGLIDEDATAIEIGLLIGGRAEVEIDDVRLEKLTPGDAPIGADARLYLDSAIAFVREQHMDSARRDWPALTSRAYRRAAGAVKPSETYIAIRGLLSAMGDNHSFLRLPSPRAPATVTATPAASEAGPLPTYSLLDGRFGLVALPGLAMFGPADRPQGQAYVDRSRKAVLALDRSPLCGWIIDLRGNGGGNIWPMLNGLTPLLGRPPFGGYVVPGEKTEMWILQEGGLVTTEGRDMRKLDLHMSGFTARHAAIPLAVLIGPETGSSGEGVAIAFAGRAGVRSFGRRSAGLTSANTTKTLSDGAVLAVPTSWTADRTGREYRVAIAPDELIEDGSEIKAASRWLSAQCERRKQ
jgi:carboxyl-terminal processing protease